MITSNQGEKLGNRKGDKEMKQEKKEQKQDRKQKQRKRENEEGGNRKVNRKRTNSSSSSSSSGRLPETPNWSETASETKWTLFPPLCSFEAGKSLRGCSAPPPPPPPLTVCIVNQRLIRLSALLFVLAFPGSETRQTGPSSFRKGGFSES